MKQGGVEVKKTETNVTKTKTLKTRIKHTSTNAPGKPQTSTIKIGSTLMGSI